MCRIHNFGCYLTTLIAAEKQRRKVERNIRRDQRRIVAEQWTDDILAEVIDAEVHEIFHETFSEELKMTSPSLLSLPGEDRFVLAEAAPFDPTGIYGTRKDSVSEYPSQPHLKEQLRAGAQQSEQTYSNAFGLGSMFGVKHGNSGLMHVGAFENVSLEEDEDEALSKPNVECQGSTFSQESPFRQDRASLYSAFSPLSGSTRKSPITSRFPNPSQSAGVESKSFPGEQGPVSYPQYSGYAGPTVREGVKLDYVRNFQESSEFRPPGMSYNMSKTISGEFGDIADFERDPSSMFQMSSAYDSQRGSDDRSRLESVYAPKEKVSKHSNQHPVREIADAPGHDGQVNGLFDPYKLFSSNATQSEANLQRAPPPRVPPQARHTPSNQPWNPPTHSRAFDYKSAPGTYEMGRHHDALGAATGANDHYLRHRSIHEVPLEGGGETWGKFDESYDVRSRGQRSENNRRDTSYRRDLGEDYRQQPLDLRQSQSMSRGDFPQHGLAGAGYGTGRSYAEGGSHDRRFNDGRGYEEDPRAREESTVFRSGREVSSVDSRGNFGNDPRYGTMPRNREHHGDMYDDRRRTHRDYDDKRLQGMPDPHRHRSAEPSSRDIHPLWARRSSTSQDHELGYHHSNNYARRVVPSPYFRGEEDPVAMKTFVDSLLENPDARTRGSHGRQDTGGSRGYGNYRYEADPGYYRNQSYSQPRHYGMNDGPPSTRKAEFQNNHMQ